ncbi:MAG TPA: HD domain-containing protein [Ilumatobacteraceae bacterium]|nr:HD domain-containing protein [Ilumatobacteraceae bacterium]
MTTTESAERRVSFTAMDDATTEELELIVSQAKVHLNDQVADRILELLRSLGGPTLGYQVDRLEHSLQTATRAMRDGARTDMIVAALLHDIGDGLAPANHSELAATIVAPYLDAEATWVVRHHGVFQGYHYWDKIGFDRHTRDRYRDSPYFDAAAHFCEAWDQRAFDPDYDTLPLEVFEPLVREVFARPASGFGAE